MKEYYLDRLHWIFRYTKKNFWYCIGKTLCLIVGVPLYAVSFLLEMVLTFINMLFSWIPFLNILISVLCKALMVAVGSTFYINVLTDIGAYKLAHKQDSEDEFAEELADTLHSGLPAACDEPTERQEIESETNDDTDADNDNF